MALSGASSRKGPGGGRQRVQLTDGSTLVLPDLLAPAAPGKLIREGAVLSLANFREDNAVEETEHRL